MNRPFGLTVIAWLAIIGGGLQILGSLGLVGIGAFGILVGSTGALETAVLLGVGFPMWTGIVLIALGAIGIVFGVGILELRPWSWTMGIVLYALNLLAGLVLLVGTGFGVTVAFVTLMSAVILAYLMAAAPREALGHARGGMPHPG